ncbi:hypothetical protein ACOME3_001222 [Neoechinorhynchus agilis]
MSTNHMTKNINQPENLNVGCVYRKKFHVLGKISYKNIVQRHALKSVTVSVFTDDSGSGTQNFVETFLIIDGMEKFAIILIEIHHKNRFL